MEVAIRNKERLTELLRLSEEGKAFEYCPTVTEICQKWKELPQVSWYKAHENWKINRLVSEMLLTTMKMTMVSSLEVGQVPMVASAIIADFGHFRIEDLHLAFMRIVKGDFKVYARLDMPTIYEALREYDDIKSKEWERLRDSLHSQEKAQGKGENSHLTVEQYWRKIGHK